MTESTAFDCLAWGAFWIAAGASVQAALATIYASRQTDPLRGWVRVIAWGAVACGSIMTTFGAGHFAGWGSL